MIIKNKAKFVLKIKPGKQSEPCKENNKYDPGIWLPKLWKKCYKFYSFVCKKPVPIKKL